MASDTLKKKIGSCWHKSKLMVAILRKYGIPGRVVFRFLKKDFLTPWAVDAKKKALVKTLPDPAYHFFVQVYLEGKWIYADPAIDQKTYKTCYRPLNYPWGNEWDGKTDHLIHTTMVASEIQLIEDIDQLVELALKAKASKPK